MYDLNHALRQWKQSMCQGGAMSAEDMDELESHLRDEVANLRKTGLSEEEAFIVAVRRLGQPAALAAEASKANPLGLWRYRFYWMAAGIFLYVSIGLVWSLLTSLSSAVLRATGAVGMGRGIGMVVTSVLCATALLLLVRRWSRHGLPTVLTPRRTRTIPRKAALLIAALAIGTILSFASAYCSRLAWEDMPSLTMQSHWTLIVLVSISALIRPLLAVFVTILVIGKHEWSRPDVIWE